MDGRRFDELAKALATQASRRGVLKTLLGGLSAAVGGALGWRGTAAQEGNPCQSDRDCRDSKCCAGTCRDILRDRNHCGSCEFGCEGDAACCNGACRDTAADRKHCGGCARACAGTDVCLGGKCCPEGSTLAGGECCPPGNVVLESKCCPAGSRIINGDCCVPAAICGRVCCLGGEVCLTPPGGAARCCPFRQVCDQTCCGRDDQCLPMGPPPRRLGCCPAARSCNTIGGPIVCCPAGFVCVPGDACCRPENVCGARCCFVDEECIDGVCVRQQQPAGAGAAEGGPDEGEPGAGGAADDGVVLPEGCVGDDECAAGHVCVENVCRGNAEPVSGEVATDYETCDGGVCNAPKQQQQIRPYQVWCTAAPKMATSAGCAAKDCRCHLYRSEKNENDFAHHADQGVKKVLDEDYDYECRCQKIQAGSSTTIDETA